MQEIKMSTILSLELEAQSEILPPWIDVNNSNAATPGNTSGSARSKK